MPSRTTTIVGVVAVGVLGGALMYAAQFAWLGSSRSAIQLSQLLRELVSVAVLGLAMTVGYQLFDRTSSHWSTTAILGLFLVAGIVGYGIGLGMLALWPPARFSLGSVWMTASLVFLDEVIPLTVAGIAGAGLKSRMARA